MFVTSRFFFAIKRLLFELQKQTLKDILQNKEQTTDKWFRDNFKWFTKQFCGKSQQYKQKRVSFHFASFHLTLFRHSGKLYESP